MNDRTRLLAAVFFTVVLFLGVQLGALALIEPFHESERQAVENPEDPANSLVYFAAILVATAFMLAAFKYDLQWMIRGLIIGVSAMLAWFVFAEIIPPYVMVGPVNAIAVAGALGVGAGLLIHPEWYVIDAAGVLMGAGAAGLFGISFGLLPALLLLAALAIYDAISVYKTKHMLSLADGVMDLKIPVIFVVPLSLSYSYLATGSTDGVIEDGSGDEPAEVGGEEETEGPEHDQIETDQAQTRPSNEDSSEIETETSQSSEVESDAVDLDTADTADTDPTDIERDALFIGLGDAVIPTILVASAAYFLDEGALEVPGIALNAPALGAMIGTIAGLLVLMHMVNQGRAHAGLPLLNGGAIGGYLIAALASGVTLTTALGL